MREKIRNFAPGVTEIHSAVEIEDKEKTVEIEFSKFSSKSSLSGLKDHTECFAKEEDTNGLEA